MKESSAKTQLELEKLKAENELLKAKAEALQSQKNVEALYSEALKAMRDYAGQGSQEEYDDYDV